LLKIEARGAHRPSGSEGRCALERLIEETKKRREILMANKEHLEILKKGVEAWNVWKEGNPHIIPDFSRAELFGTDLNKANLENAEFREANLREANLSQANLREANLRKANLSGAHLKETDLRNADLTNANLRKSILTKAKLNNAILRSACLQDADLGDVDGLMTEQLGDTDVSGAMLPEAIAEFEAIKIVEETSKAARKLFLSMLLACLYCGLTISTTTDPKLLTNSATSPLPIVGASIPIVGFYIVAPLLLLGLYFYFHFSLQRLWEEFSELPALFLDGVSLDKKVTPWLFNSRVCFFFSNLRDRKPPLFWLQRLLIFLLAWWLIPFMLFLFWGRYLCRHDLTIIIIHSIILFITLLSAIYFQHLSVLTLYGKKRKPNIKDIKFDGKIISISIISIYIFLFSISAVKGLPNEYQISENPPGFAMRIGISFLALFGFETNQNFSDTDISIKPDNWPQLAKEEDSYLLVKGVNLKGRNLNNILAPRAFLINSNLEGAYLVEAYLSGADFRGADLRRADFRRAYLVGANFRGTFLTEADLSEADLNGANLSGAIGLTIEQLSKVKGLYKAELDPNLERQIMEKYPHLLMSPWKRKNRSE